jgi:hypothetical protein
MKKKMNFGKNLTTVIFLTFILFYPLFYFVNKINAISMNSSTYKIESASVSNAAARKSSDTYRLVDTLGQLAAGEASSSGYILKAGFQYIHSIIPFRFSISKTQIDLGTLIPNTFSTDATILTVSFGGSGQYQVTAEELGPLTTLNGSNYIQDTQCNGGADTCSEALAKLWTSTSAYGFGYNMAGDDIPSDFINTSYFRPFPDRNQNEPPVAIMASNNVGKNRQATLTFKANIPPTQAAGTYQTIINFIATPSF